MYNYRYFKLFNCCLFSDKSKYFCEWYLIDFVIDELIRRGFRAVFSLVFVAEEFYKSF